MPPVKESKSRQTKDSYTALAFILLFVAFIVGGLVYRGGRGETDSDRTTLPISVPVTRLPFDAAPIPKESILVTPTLKPQQEAPNFPLPPMYIYIKQTQTIRIQGKWTGYIPWAITDEVVTQTTSIECDNQKRTCIEARAYTAPETGLLTQIFEYRIITFDDSGFVAVNDGRGATDTLIGDSYSETVKLARQYKEGGQYVGPLYSAFLVSDK
jgi:hypothetical protein